MPLNASTYLTTQGWKGKGTSLDGPNGNGLKKPLVITQKKNLGGIGKDRDRAVEWWDCLFEVSITRFHGIQQHHNSIRGPERKSQLSFRNFDQEQEADQVQNPFDSPSSENIFR